MRRLVDCGFIVAVLEDGSDQGSPGQGESGPTLTFIAPAGEDTEAQSLCLWDTEGLHNLRDALGEFLDRLDASQEINPGD